jgi:hypothetical protein
MKITKRSDLSGREHTMEIDVTHKQLDRYENDREHIQVVFPDLTADEREFIMTGITTEEWGMLNPESN